MNTEEKIKQQLAELPDNPGVYLFYDNKKELIYVGKATSLRDRVKSYFRTVQTGRPIEAMIHEVVSLKTVSTDSVLESAILEGEYIKKYRPKYNIKWRDDKSWNYILLTNEDYSRVLTVRERELKQFSSKAEGFGPYPGMNMKEMVKLLRKLFKISTCKPLQKRPCLYYQMNQCLGVCTGEISSKDYQKKVIHPLVLFLQGKKKQLLKNLEKEMNHQAKMENFEEAARLRNQIKMLQRIQDIALLNSSFVEDENVSEIKLKIEGYDISNLGESDKVGSLVVFDQNGPIKSEYKKFKIKTVVGQSDVDCLEEVLRRRLNHAEWSLPDIFLIDGGKPQVNKVKKVLEELKINKPVIGIAKGAERKKNEFIAPAKFLLNSELEKLLIQVRDEAHRFAIKYQRSLRKI